ncbi:type II secretion system F family protein [Methanocaldococcus sp.]
MSDLKDKLEVIKIKVYLFLMEWGIVKIDPKILNKAKDLGLYIAYKEPLLVAVPDEEEKIIREYMDVLLYSKEDTLGRIANKLASIIEAKYSLRYELIVLGYKDLTSYFKRVFFYSFIAFILIFIYNLLDGKVIEGLINGLIASIIIIILSPIFPKIRLLMSKGEIRMQVLLALLFMISLLRAGASLPEVLSNLAKSNEYGIISFECKVILKEIEMGYSLLEALERAKLRSKIPLVEKFFEQIIVGYNKGNLALLLEKFYENIVTEALSKLDTSKFLIQNLGNLTFGTGVILPFTGMLLSAMMGNQGFQGIANALNFIMINLGPMLSAIFGIFVKMKVE